MPEKPSKVVHHRLRDNARELRLALLARLMGEVNALRINVGPRHPAQAHFKAAYSSLAEATMAVRDTK